MRAVRVNWPFDGKPIPGVDTGDVAKMAGTLASNGLRGPYTLFIAKKSKPRRKPSRDHHSIPEGEAES